jgi:hypothetical protein
LDAAVAALEEVTFEGDTCDSELPAAVFDALPLEAADRTLDDLVATRELVTFVPITTPKMYCVCIQ